MRRKVTLRSMKPSVPKSSESLKALREPFDKPAPQNIKLFESGAFVQLMAELSFPDAFECRRVHCIVWLKAFP